MRKISFISLLISLLLFNSCSSSERVFADKSFNSDWLFYKGEAIDAEYPNYDDTNWRKLDLPHDWAIEGPFSDEHNARSGGLPVHGTGWYRKHFEVDKSMKGKLISVEFDGAMSNANVWLNGNFVGERPYGYIGFEFDLTPYIKFGEENVIAVRLQPEDLSSRWYPGAGIYRNVKIKYNNPVHIPQWGTYITTPIVTDETAKVNVRTDVVNKGENNANVSLQTEVYDANDNKISESSHSLDLLANDKQIIDVPLEINSPTRWDINNPYLYKVKSILKIDDVVVDEFDSQFGVRTIEFTPNDGFLLNGRRVQFNGVCMHHDLGPLGAAVNYRAIERQMQIMQSMGVNAIRTSHNPPAPELLEICDRLGLLVQVESFDEWRLGKVANGYHKHFDEWHERDLRDMIRRDRNHPSVIMWSIGNEILEQNQKDGWKLTKHLTEICHDEDPTRPTTAGFNYFPAPFTNKLVNYVDVVGMNYWPLQYGNVKKENPDMIIYGSETSSMTSSRGEYHLPISGELAKETGHVSSYDVIYGPAWTYPADVEFQAIEDNPFSLGEFMWTGFDYLGEPTPYSGRDNETDGYWNSDWPSRSSYFAPVDLSGFPKDRFYLYQSQWTTEPMVHVLPHWNWEGHEGDKIPVYAYTNAEEVELFVNGKSFGKKVKGKDLTAIPADFHDFEKGIFMSKYRLSWEVPYEPGEIKVVAYSNNEKVAEKVIETAGAPAKIKLVPDRSSITADGTDLSFITVRIEDEDGNLCPNADNLVSFDISGDGVLAAVGNGNQRSLESFQEPQRKAFNGLCLLVVKSTPNGGKINIKATSEGLEGVDLEIITH